MWGDDSPLCLFCLDGDLLALSYRSASLLRGSSPAVISTAPSTWKSKPLQKWNTIREGEKSLISPHLIHANNAPQQPELRATERQHAPPCYCEGGWMGEQGGTRATCSCVTHETFHLRGFFLSVGLENED